MKLNYGNTLALSMNMQKLINVNFGLIFEVSAQKNNTPIKIRSGDILLEKNVEVASNLSIIELIAKGESNEERCEI